MPAGLFVLIETDGAENSNCTDEIGRGLFWIRCVLWTRRVSEGHVLTRGGVFSGGIVFANSGGLQGNKVPMLRLQRASAAV